MSKTEKVLLVLIVVSGIAIAADCICQCGPRAAMRCEDGGASPERFALLDNGGSLHPQVLVMWRDSMGVSLVTAGLLFSSNQYALTLYQSENRYTGRPIGDAVVIPWKSVGGAWWMERGIPLEGNR